MHKRTSPFTDDIYKAIVKEMERLNGDISEAGLHRINVLEGWKELIESDHQIEMTIFRNPPWPLRL